MNNEVKVTVESGIQELVVRHGNAAEVYPPRTIVEKGKIAAPIEYFNSRRKVKPDYFDLSKALVLVNRKDNVVSLFHDPTNTFGDVIHGQLIVNPILKEFGLSASGPCKYFAPNELAQVFRQNIRFFDSQDEARKMIFELKNLKLNTNGKVERSTDDRGNKKNNFEQSVESNIPVSFTLKMPLFDGEKPVRFTVEIFLEVNGSSVSCVLDSIMMAELFETERDQKFDQMAEAFRAAEVVVLEI